MKVGNCIFFPYVSNIDLPAINRIGTIMGKNAINAEG
jgi:hypothetical protein